MTMTAINTEIIRVARMAIYDRLQKGELTVLKYYKAAFELTELVTGLT